MAEPILYNYNDSDFTIWEKNRENEKRGYDVPYISGGPYRFSAQVSLANEQLSRDHMTKAKIEYNMNQEKERINTKVNFDIIQKENLAGNFVNCSNKLNNSYENDLISRLKYQEEEKNRVNSYILFGTKK